VVVVGGGYAGVELAAVLGERLLGGPAAGRCRVTLVTPGDGVLEGCAEGQRAAAQEALSKLNVEVLTNTRVTRLSPPVIPDSPSTSASGTTSSSSMSSGNGDAWQDPQQQQQTRPGHCLVYLEPRSSSSGASSSGASSSGVPPSSVLEADMVLWTAGAAPVSKFIQVGGCCWAGGVLGGACISVPCCASITAAGPTSPELTLMCAAAAGSYLPDFSGVLSWPSHPGCTRPAFISHSRVLSPTCSLLPCLLSCHTGPALSLQLSWRARDRLHPPSPCQPACVCTGGCGRGHGQR
jgi:hypothetical protein